jgi:HPt (histidine-containing phosphotransfer) domain-containing protein
MDEKSSENTVLNWSKIIAVAGSKEAAKDIMQMYIAALPDFKKKIGEYSAAKNYDAMREEVHKLTGTAAYFSAQLRQASYDLETAIVLKKEPKKIASSVKSIKQMIDRVLAAYDPMSIY